MIFGWKERIISPRQRIRELMRLKGMPFRYGDEEEFSCVII
ncbi:hypothetical protein HMPREF0908_1879 [Selenomonas flueggei ATCC 43531]|uniref:Uncharacterized protein n=1 Tax=Selenomonas flueggei ATCC 43531 TaxID=638302 RepID=C4V5X9_9FIRM|nr:hypothetical protein HMPREF0908_1879 [Selenomonas flueggei ATCC 43531]